MAKANAKPLATWLTQELATKKDLLNLKHEILKWAFGMMVVQTALIMAAFGIGNALLK